VFGSCGKLQTQGREAAMPACTHVDCSLVHVYTSGFAHAAAILSAPSYRLVLAIPQTRLRLPSVLPAEERLRAIADAQMETEIAAARAHAEAVKNHGR